MDSNANQKIRLVIMSRNRLQKEQESRRLNRICPIIGGQSRLNMLTIDVTKYKRIDIREE